MTDVLEPWQAEAVRAGLPQGARLISTCWQTVSGRAIRMSPDDLPSLMEDKVRARLPDGPQAVLSLRVEDFDPEREAVLVALAEATDGGVVVVGVAYELGGRPSSKSQECPECGAQHLERPDAGHAGPGPAVLQCAECGSAWDA